MVPCWPRLDMFASEDEATVILQEVLSAKLTLQLAFPETIMIIDLVFSK